MTSPASTAPGVVEPARLYPRATVLVLATTDLAVLFAVNALTVWVRWELGGAFAPALYWRLAPALLLFLLVYETAGLYHGTCLYPGVSLGPAEEIRRLTYATTGVYLGLVVLSFLFKAGTLFSRAIFLVAWGLSLVLVPAARFGLRALLCQRPWWGVPALVLGTGEAAAAVVRALLRQPEFGIKPVGILDPQPAPDRPDVSGVPVRGTPEHAPALARALRVDYAIVALPGLDAPGLQRLLDTHVHAFAHVLVVPELFRFANLWVSAKDLGGFLGLELRQQLLRRGPRAAKFAMDFTLGVAGGLVLLPLILLIALLVRLSSPGPVFYGAPRLGRGGRSFTVWKFRTMVEDANRRLEAHLRNHPDQAAEWHTSFKLREDPRVTAVGRFLRLTSLDELPQFWNLLRGDMSLVGPRPIVAEEIPRYGELFELYKQVRPGISGLWQVSGRNDTTYADRVALDAYYVRNWSPWLDLYILARTVGAVIRCRGAY